MSILCPTSRGRIRSHLSVSENLLLSITTELVCVGGGGGVRDRFLSLEFIEIDIFLLLACPTKILHPQSKISPLELSLSGCLFHCGMTML